MDMAGINTEMRKLHNYPMISTKAKSYRLQTSITMKPLPTPTFERNINYIISLIDLTTSLGSYDPDPDFNNLEYNIIN